jgi:glycosyltransferase involved in cell wall biosynthesis
MKRRADAPPVSIVTPVWNAAGFIEETITSVMSQLGDEDEYIIVDDGSTDGTEEVLASLQKTYGFRLLKQANGGEGAAVNRGVEAASNDLVCVVNGDDPILPGLLTHMKETFRNEPELAAAYPDWLMIDEKGAILRTVRTIPYSYRTMLAEHFCIPGPGTFFRRSAFAGEPCRDPRAEGLSDFDCWLRLGCTGSGMRRVSEVLATWRSHPSGTTATMDGAKLARAKIELMTRFFARDDLPSGVRALEAQAFSAAYYHAALLGIRRSGVPSLRYAVASYRHKLVWPADVYPTQRRSLPHLLYAVTQPFSGWCHRLVDPFLPERFRRARVLSQTFGAQ